MIGDHAFPRHRRIRKSSEYKEVFDHGKTVYGRFSRLHVMPEPRSESRLGVVISRRLKGSVRRNRLKRLIREYFRLNYTGLVPGPDCVIVVSKMVTHPDYDSIRAELDSLFKRAGMHANYTNSNFKTI